MKPLIIVAALLLLTIFVRGDLSYPSLSATHESHGAHHDRDDGGADDVCHDIPHGYNFNPPCCDDTQLYYQTIVAETEFREIDYLYQYIPSYQFRVKAVDFFSTKYGITGFDVNDPNPQYIPLGCDPTLDCEWLFYPYSPNPDYKFRVVGFDNQISFPFKYGGKFPITNGWLDVNAIVVYPMQPTMPLGGEFTGTSITSNCLLTIGNYNMKAKDKLGKNYLIDPLDFESEEPSCLSEYGHGSVVFIVKTSNLPSDINVGRVIGGSALGLNNSTLRTTRMHFTWPPSISDLVDRDTCVHCNQIDYSVNLGYSAETYTSGGGTTTGYGGYRRSDEPNSNTKKIVIDKRITNRIQKVLPF